MTLISIRKAVPDDLADLVSIQLESWQRTYTDVLPDNYRHGAMAEDLQALWTEDRLAKDLVLVAEIEGRVAGLAGVILETETRAYLDNLHVAKSDEGQGVGRKLMVATAQHALALGRTVLHLTVVTGNARALGFYEDLGGARMAAITDAMFGHDVQAYPIYWEGSTLTRLAGLPGVAEQGRIL